LETTSPHEKTCKGCLTSKTLSEFSANKDGKCRNYCRECSNTKRSEKRKNEYLEMRTTKRGHVLVAAAKYRAGKMGIPFDLCEKDIQSRIEAGRCELTGMEFDLLAPKAWNTPSLDQIKPGAGYTRDNVRVILYAMNVMSHTWGPNKVAEIAMALMEKRKERSNDLSDRIGMQLQKTLPTGSLEYELTWIRRVTPSGRVYWQHRASGHRTSGSDCTGWQSPVAGDAKGVAYRRDGGQKGKERLTNLGLVAGWPTPQTVDGEKTGMSTNRGDGQHRSRTTPQSITALAGWPTPRAQDNDQGNQEEIANAGSSWLGQNRGATVSTMAQLAGWPTASATDGERGGEKTENMTGTSLQQVAALSGWSTPRMTVRGPESKETRKARGAGGASLEDQVAGWATPRVTTNGGHGNQDRAKDARLEDQAQLSGWDSPTVADADKTTARSKQGIPRQLPSGSTSTSSPAETEKRGVLNPEFVAWLMGYSQDWLKCAPSTAKGKKKCTSAAV
jgi:hypothetical protein